MKVAAIILAAGSSSRFGQPKQLVRLDDQALVRRIVLAALEAKCRTLVVVGEAEQAIVAEVNELAVEVISNPDWREGMGASIRAGVESAMESDAIILLTCDQPLVRPQTLLDLVALHRTSRKPIVASSYSKTLGIPALFDRSCFAALLELSGDHGAKGIILSRRDEVAIYDFPDGAIDIDTPSDLRLLPSEKFSEGIENPIR